MIEFEPGHGPRRGADPLSIAATVFFLAAVSAAAYPAFRAGPATGPSLLLLIGLAGFSVLGLFAFAASEPAALKTADGGAQALVDALSEPAAVTAADGSLSGTNLGWRAMFGGFSRRLPKAESKIGAGLYSALATARRDGASEAAVSTRDGPRRAQISRLGGDRLLVRLVAMPVEPDHPPESAVAVASAPSRDAPIALDVFTAAAPFGAALLDGGELFSARIVQANAALDAMTAGAAAPDALFADLLDAPSRADAAAKIAAGRGGPFEVRLATPTPKTAQLYLTALDGRLTAYLLDVSEQKALELQLSQAQKMQAIGQLAGGVAHDFNNLLSAIQLRLDELLHRHPVGDPSYEGLNEIRQTAVRAADLVRKLLAFSRKQTVQRETLELGELISESEVLLRRLLREDVRLVTEHGRDLPLIRADKSQLETAVMNLAVNARDALRSHGTHDGGVGVVRIRTARVSRDAAFALGFTDAPREGAALIEVADNGPGIPEDALDKIFEPFFTTKPVGEGTGLGLATVYGIVKQMDGWIQVENLPASEGGGAAFRILLPIHVLTAVEAAPVPAAAKPKPAARDLSGAGRILFVEDEDAVRVVAARLLRARGYEVIEAADGEEALELAEEHAGKIDLLISDVIMPGLDGPTLLKKARKFLDGAQVMFISGYAEAEFSDMLEGEEGVTFLPKPIDIKVLAERVKQQLQAG